MKFMIFFIQLHGLLKPGQKSKLLPLENHLQAEEMFEKRAKKYRESVPGSEPSLSRGINKMCNFLHQTAQPVY